MRALAGFLSLPAGLITVAVLLADTGNIAAAAHELLEWPYNLPRTEKYYPEHESHVKRELAVQQRLAWQKPVGVRKMSGDPGEKFFLDYWDFGEQLRVDEVSLTSDNSSQLVPAVSLHTYHERSALRLFGRDLLSRGFQCPSGTNACTNIGQADLCCNSGETCVSTSSGVGCCPNGQSCGTNVASCDTSAGYTSCPNSNNGGCCVPGAQCLDTGCVFYGTQVVTTTLPTATVTASQSSSTHTSTYIPVTSSTVISLSGSTATVTIAGVGTTVTTTVVSPTTIVIVPVTSGTSSSSAATTCSSGFFSCPASLGGGCCANGQACATGNQCPDTVSSGTASAPVRGTTVAPSSESSSSTLTTYASVCPAGFYMCSAVYLGGCCQVDRDCHTMSCPPTASTSILTSGVTAVVPVAGGGGGTVSTAATDSGATTTASSGATTSSSAPSTTVPSGTCVAGWYLCAASDGGGCCPSGYSCGASCTASASGVAPQAKENPSIAAANSAAVVFFTMGLIIALGMIMF